MDPTDFLGALIAFCDPCGDASLECRLPGGHTFVSFNPQVMKLTAEYLLKDKRFHDA